MDASFTVIPPEEYAQRREALMAKVPHSTVILRSAPMAVMHNDVDYNFRQDSNFFYFTGFNEADAVAVLAPHHAEHRFILFVQPKDREKETWTGYRVGVEAAKERYGADIVYEIKELDEKLPQYIEKADRIYYHFSDDRAFNDRIIQHWQSQLRYWNKRGIAPIALEDPALVINPLRSVKSEAEMRLMRQAAQLGIEAHQLALQQTKPGCFEYEIQAAMEQHFRAHGAWGPAYPTIVASGENACILHYIENTRQMEEGDLLLIDGGCSWHYYNSDITRTFPVGKTFSAEQRTLYELVLTAQEVAIDKVQPGTPWNEYHDAAVRVLVEGLVELGLLQGSLDELLEGEKYKPFYMHRTGHWLGLDVHDAGICKIGETWQPFQPGQVVTVEPGLYIRPDIQPAEGQPPIADRWKGIGIRIEDNVLVTETGHEVLTQAVPKAIADLEYRS
ncbi:MAG: aminopeptidase P N-terminal domain-containing protein [Prochlorotrichaceae cyanobacterium]|jgi:Xaa-Pro aminopeptidase